MLAARRVGEDPVDVDHDRGSRQDRLTAPIPVFLR